MPEPSEVVLALDVDNTLLDNDRVTPTSAFSRVEVGTERLARYWEIFEELRARAGLRGLSRRAAAIPRRVSARSPRAGLSTYLVEYPFANRLYPESLDVIDCLKSLGPVAILSDGDVVFQPRKIERSGLWAAVDGNVLIYVHKEHELDDVGARFPAERYVLIDDKLRMLAAIKSSGAARDDGVSAPGPLRARSRDPGQVSTRRRDRRADRRPAAPRSHGSSRLLDVEQLDLEFERGIGRDDAARAARAVAEVRRDHQCAFAADLHAGNAFVPAFDHAAAAERERKRLAPVARAVELGAVEQPAGVVDDDRLAGGASVPVPTWSSVYLSPSGNVTSLAVLALDSRPACAGGGWGRLQPGQAVSTAATISRQTVFIRKMQASLGIVSSPGKRPNV